MKKRALLIIPNCLDSIGGIETYNKYLIEILEERNFIVDLYIINSKRDGTPNKNINSKNIYFNDRESLNIIFDIINNRRIWKFFSVIYEIFYVKLKFKKFIKNKKFNLIIDNTNLNFKKLRKNKNCIWVQHFSKIFLEKSNEKKIIKWLFGFINLIVSTQNSHNKYKNLVCFEPEKELFTKKNNNVFGVNTCSKKQELSQDNKNKNIIVFCGRIVDNQKNIKLIIEINKHLKKYDYEIYFYGAGKDENLLKNNKFFGFYENNDLGRIYSNAIASICMSNYEGMPMSLIESLSFGKPIIVMNNFLSAKYMVNNGNNGILINKNDNCEDICKKILLFFKKNEFNKDSIEEFFTQNLSFDYFKNKWNEIINEISS